MTTGFDSMSIRAKLQLLVGTILVLMLILSMQGIYSQHRQGAALMSSLGDAEAAMEAMEASDQAALHFKIQVQEWKNILLRGHDQKEFDKYLQAFQREHATVDSFLVKCAAVLQRLGADTSPVTKAKDEHTALLAKYLDAIRQFDRANPASYQLVDKAVRGIDRQATVDIDKLSEIANGVVTKRFADSRTDSAANEKFSLVLGLVLLAVAVLAGAAIGVVLIRGITAQIDHAVSATETVAAGDLTVQFSSTSRDEIGRLLGKLREMTAGLSRIVGEVRMGSFEILSASRQISGANMDLSARTEEQASAIEETSSTLEQMTATVRQNNEHTQHASGLMSKAGSSAENGEAAMREAVQSMSSINGSSRRIAEIIGVIDGIAFQTNILALNAAVEAARAGEHGRGFAVVAAEVRALSQRSATAAKEIKQLIDDAVTQVSAGDKHVLAASEAMSEILQGVRQASDLLADIATATREQTIGIEQVNTTISQMEQVTQENASMVEEAAAAAQSLNDQAERFLEIIAQFKLAEGDAPPAPTATIVSRHTQAELRRRATSARIAGHQPRLAAN